MCAVSEKDYPEYRRRTPDDLKKFKRRYQTEKRGHWCTIYGFACKMDSCDKCPRDRKK
jgi:hypothetical protein